MSDFKIINLGLPKTGTTTLTRALRRACIPTVDWKVHKRQTPDESLHGQHLGTLMYRDYFDSGDPLKRLTKWRAFNELSHAGLKHSLWPQTDWGLLSAILKHHPDTRFMLNTRDPERTAASIIRWGNLGSLRLPNTNVPGLPKGYGEQSHIARWIEAHYAFVRRVFSGADNFLEFDITDSDAPKKIGAFLDTKLPWWGRANARPEADTPMLQPEMTDN
ncbi:sulfotransferase family protein [Lentibacter algarum]|uniref:sulfotransferase n=1 Tax=Lentibacter algarum TaxID=576131 RepID=UPI001C08AD1E|nr:sulfotransferase [Lentibacter algarum]MBU2982592.1 sulfotransferase family protein [Lentibacter algarum]